MRNLLVISLGVILLCMGFACSKQEGESGDQSSSNIQSVKFLPPESGGSAVTQNMVVTSEEDAEYKQAESDTRINPQIIQTGDLHLQTEQIDSTKNYIIRRLKLYKGYVQSDDFNNTESESSYQLMIRIPSDAFSSFLNDAEKSSSKVTYKSIRADDVTEEFIDIETRLKNKKAYLEKLNEFLKKATKMSDLLEIQEKIRLLEEEMESAQGRLNYIQHQVRFSSLSLRLVQLKPYQFTPPPAEPFWEQFKKAWSQGLLNMKDLFLWSISSWPYVVFLIFVYGMIKWWKKRKNKSSSPH